jgi:glycosyltransferase involved in cell wall biosynthesis
MSQPLVSVGIPTYNRPEGLKRTLEQICAQTYTNLEIVISDNCSPDEKVQEIILMFAEKDPRIKGFRQSENIGPANNFEFVLHQATGEYFMWATDDDEWDPKFIKTCLDNIFDCDFVMQNEFLQKFRSTGIEVKQIGAKLSTSNTNFQNLRLFLENPVLYTFYGLYKTDSIKSIFVKPNFDGFDWYITISTVALFKVNTFEETLFFSGIDADDYIQKPFFKHKRKHFIWTPMRKRITSNIFKSKQLGFFQKIKVVFSFYIKLAHLFINYEKEHRPNQVRFVSFWLRTYLFLKNKLSFK